MIKRRSGRRFSDRKQIATFLLSAVSIVLLSASGLAVAWEDAAPPGPLTKSQKANMKYTGAAIGAPLRSPSVGPAFQSGTQVVFLDFDTETATGEHVYTAAERSSVKSLMEGHYMDFDFSFSLTMPVSGDYSTVFLNKGSAGGLADKIDFRNLDANDTAAVNVSPFGFATSAEIVSSTAIIASHELGHLAGLRHGDSYGPIGAGISSTGVPGTSAYLPAYPGPQTADETRDRLMASPASVGSSLGDTLTPSWFSERSAVKLAFNEGGSLVAESGANNSMGTADSIALAPLPVPNTIVSGANAGKVFDVEALAVSGSLLTLGDSDWFSFTGVAGDLFNFELISSVVGFRLSPFDTTISILDSTGILVDYYGGSPAFNDDEFESRDSIIIDLVLPADDIYSIRVGSFADSGTGDYELLLYSFSVPIPVPGTLPLALVGIAGYSVRRTRRNSR